MKDDKKTELIAKYQVLQGTINTTAQFIIQTLGFSIAAIIALIVASLTTKTVYPLYIVIGLIYYSVMFINNQTQVIIDTETYIDVFIESNLTTFKWKQRTYDKYVKRQKALFLRQFIFSNFARNIYIAIIFSCFILLSSDLLLNSDNKIFLNNVFNNVISCVLIFLNICFLVWVFYNLTPYSRGKYYSKCKDDWQKMKEEEELENLEQVMSQKPPQAKLVESNGKEFSIPESAYPVLHQVIQIIASGETVSVIPQKREVTTQEAAELLNVPRPYLIKLLEEGKIPYTKVGLHQYIRYEDVMAYKKQRDTQRREGLRELTQFLQDEGFYE